MSKKTDTLTDFDRQLIAGMEEVVAHTEQFLGLNRIEANLIEETQQPWRT